MKTRDLGWVAGLLEGEGWFIVQSGRYPVVGMAMTDEDVVIRLHNLLGGNIHGPYKSRGGNKPYWQWNISRNDDAVALMMTLWTLMGTRRREQIERCLRVWRSTTYANRGGRWPRVEVAV